MSNLSNFKFKVREFWGKKIDFNNMLDLADIQLTSYSKFLQNNVLPENRNPKYGLESIFKSIFPIESNNKNLVLEYLYYSFGEVKCTEYEAKANNVTYSIILKAVFQLIQMDTGEVKKKELYMGDIPLMTDRGTFIINGSERVVVSQIHKSPGVFFTKDNKTLSYSARIVPDRGAWIEFEINIQKSLFYAKVDRKKGILLTVFLRIIGYETNSEIINLFYPNIKVSLTDKAVQDMLYNSEKEICLAEDILDFKAGQEILKQDYEKLISFGYNDICIIDPDSIKQNRIILNCLDNDDTQNQEQAIYKFFSYFRSTDPNIIDNMSYKDFSKIFFDSKFYNLGVGRYKINQKLYPNISDEELPVDPVMVNEDIIRTVKYLLNLYNQKETIDDIDHLGNRRIRCVDELLTNQLRVAFSRVEKNIREKMSIDDDLAELTPQKLIGIKPIMVSIKEFFGSSQLSQFMDQVNPLAELTHKRRLNALGPGGLTRDRAGFEVRDVHYTHYGKICPIETPEGPNIGLILSLANYSMINEYGFLVTPYYKVEKGKVLDKIQYLTALEEDRYYIAQSGIKIDTEGFLIGDVVVGRKKGEFKFVSPYDISYIDVSLFQIVGVSTALIPFLEHNDANRALMGANMQRQAVPFMFSEAPIIGTGMEWKSGYDSKVCLISKNAGKVEKVDSKSITIRYGKDEKDIDTYNLIKYERTNQNTVSNQYPIVKEGEDIEKGQVIADGAATDNGELALGKNLLIGFMSFEGYNFEDAIVISERLIKDDVLTSLHIEEFQVDVRETKLGVERVTKDLPNISEQNLVNLDENGIVRIGAWVSSSSVLVGKVTPKTEIVSTPEYKLLHSIFGEKAGEVKDTSLYYPSGVSPGIVIGIHFLTRQQGFEMPPGVEKIIKVYVLKKRRISIGDKMAGRHGNKGVISKIVPEEDMPFLKDGRALDIILNPLSVPSRMNIGQLLEVKSGFLAYHEKKKFAFPMFCGIRDENLKSRLRSIGESEESKIYLYDGKTGERFENKVFVGVIYMLKLNHMVDDKIHARSTGPYSLVTQQPLGGKAQEGGQRLGEMEVWALQAYGASYTLQEFLTVKADDMEGRTKIYENIVRNKLNQAAGITESFNVLIQELRGLGLDIKIYDKKQNILALTDKDVENLNKQINKNEI